MRLSIIILLLTVVSSLVGSFVLQDFSCELPPDLDIPSELLLRAAAIKPGMALEAQDIPRITESLQSYFHSLGDYYVAIAAPQIEPLGENRIALRYRVSRLADAANTLLRFEGLRYFSESRIRELLFLQADSSVGLSSVDGIISRIVSIYNSRGYLFAAVALDSLLLDEERKLTAVLRIDEGSPFRLREIVCEGNLYSRDQTLIRLSGLSGISTITPQILAEAEERILVKSYIQDCSIIPLDSSSLLIRIREGKMSYLEGVAGLSRSGGSTKLNGLINLRFLNLWGTDRAISLYWKGLPEGSSDLRLAYHESGFNRYPVAADLALSRSSQDSTWVKSRVSTDIYYYNQYHRLGMELLFDEISPGSRRPIQIQRDSNRSLGAFWAYQKLDNLRNPSTGMETNLRYRIFLGADADEPASALEADTVNYLRLTNRWVLALGIHLKSLDKLSSEAYNQFSMGGYKSLRGYREDAFRSWRLAWLNAELRYRLGAESRLYAFFDQAAIINSAEELQTDLFAIGLGIKLRSRIGILSLEYALGNRDKGLWDFGLGVIHLGLDAAF